MKTHLVAAALAVPCVLAHAQSAVTLYGLIDTGISYVSNVGGRGEFVANDGIIQPGRFGLTGKEDIGGRTQVVFTLENGFSLNTGADAQSGLMFGRQAFVGFSHPGWGTLTFGRQYDFIWDYVTIFSIGSRVGAYAFHPGDYDHLGGSLRINNAVKYSVSPFGGLSIGALYAFGSDSTGSTNNIGVPGNGRVIAAGARYTGGVASVALAYNSVHGATLAPATQIGTMPGPGFPAGTFAATSMRNIEAAGSLTFGPSSTRALFTATTIATPAASATLRTWEISESYAVTPTVFISAGYAYTRMSPSTWRDVAVIVDYFLSKRTDVYVSASTQTVSGGARAAFLTLPASSDGHETAARLGIRTLF
jgi:predicted porin